MKIFKIYILLTSNIYFFYIETKFINAINRVLNNNIHNSYDSSTNESIQWDDIGGLDDIKVFY